MDRNSYCSNLTALKLTEGSAINIGGGGGGGGNGLLGMGGWKMCSHHWQHSEKWQVHLLSPKCNSHQIRVSILER